MLPPFSQALGPQSGPSGRTRASQQEALADRSGLHVTYISLLERGRNSPTLDAIGSIAAALGVRPSELVKAAEEAGA